jgi:hypothetical protein
MTSFGCGCRRVLKFIVVNYSVSHLTLIVLDMKCISHRP